MRATIRLGRDCPPDCAPVSDQAPRTGKHAPIVERVAREGDVNQARAATSTPGIGRVVEVIDRSFPLLWVGFYLLLPVSGWATVMFESWFDQQRDLEALNPCWTSGRADAIADNVIGPAYIAAAALLHSVFGLSPEDSLVALTRGSYALSAAAGMVLVRALLRGLVSAPPFASLAAQLAFAALIFSAGTGTGPDVPWSHFFAAYLAAAIYAVRFAPSRLTSFTQVRSGSCWPCWLLRGASS